jgi:hypothetical protein
VPDYAVPFSSGRGNGTCALASGKKLTIMFGAGFHV